MLEKIKKLKESQNFWTIFSMILSFFVFFALLLIVIFRNNTFYYDDADEYYNLLTWSDISSNNIVNLFEWDDFDYEECNDYSSVWDRCWWWIVFYIWNNLWPANKRNILVAQVADVWERLSWSLPWTNMEWALHNTFGYWNTEYLAEMWSIAALSCWDSEVNWYSDWYLPSNRELYQLWLLSDFARWNAQNKWTLWWFNWFRYWSSTQADLTNAMSMYFSHANPVRYNKRAEWHIRCIRVAN